MLNQLLCSLFELGRHAAVTGSPWKSRFGSEIDARLGLEDHVRFLRQVLDRFKVDPVRRANLLARIDFVVARADDPQLRLAVVGEFSSGKSTFINALLGRQLLKSAHQPTTAAATLLTYGKTLRVDIEFADGSACSATEASSRALRDRLKALRPSAASVSAFAELLTLLCADTEIASQVSQLRVAVPAEVLKGGLAIIDTPGIEAAGAEGLAHAAITERVLREEADAAIVLVPANAPMSRSLIGFLESEVKPFLHRCSFAITKADQVSDGERTELVEYVASRLNAIVGAPVEVTEVAAVTALPTIAPLPVHLAASWRVWQARFGEMSCQLVDRVLKQRALIVSERLVRLLQDLLGALQNDARARVAQLAEQQAELDSNSVEQLDSALERIAERCAEFVCQAVERLRAKIREEAKRFEAAAKRDANELIDGADSNSLGPAAKYRVPEAIAKQQAIFAQRIGDAHASFGQDAKEARAIFAGEFERRYRALAALGVDGSVRQIGVAKLPHAAGQFIATKKFVDSQVNAELGRGVVGAGSLALAGFCVAGPVGSAVGALVGLFLGLSLGSGLEERRRQVRQLVEPEIASHVAACLSAALESANLAQESLNQTLKQIGAQNRAAYAAAVARLIASFQKRKAASSEELSQAAADARELERRSAELEETRMKLLGRN